MIAISWNRDAFTPRQITSSVVRMGIFVGCLGLLALVTIVEIVVPNNPTLGGFLLLGVLFAAWLLPTAFSAVITLFAIAVTLFTAVDGAVDPLTAKFQFTAVVVTACLSEMTARSLVARDRAQAATTDQLRRFTADAAHELRNPLSALQSELEITLRQERSSEELTATVRLALKNTQRLVKISEVTADAVSKRCRWSYGLGGAHRLERRARGGVCALGGTRIQDGRPPHEVTGLRGLARR